MRKKYEVKNFKNGRRYRWTFKKKSQDSERLSKYNTKDRKHEENNSLHFLYCKNKCVKN